MLHGKLLSVTTKAGIGQGYTLEAVVVIRDRAVICIHPVPVLPRGTAPAQERAAIQRKSGFTREYGGGVNSERRVEIGQQARPFRG
ncbi:hypothetical protein CIK02_08890 [Pseudomonas putida]|nr:hypothetical protein CIK02_08890 [Pseudomonas putida]TFF52737.1 hypothetical protein C5609_06780 [Pseudomonas putida]